MRRLLSVIVFISLAISANAQYGSYFGFSGGASLNSFQKGGLLAEETVEPTFGLHFTGIYGFRFSEYIGFQTGLQYTAKGGTLNYEGESKFILQGQTRKIIVSGTREMEQQIKYHTLNAPAQFTINPISKFQIGLGGYIGIAVSSKMTGHYEIVDGITDNQTPLMDPYKVKMTGNYFSDKRGPGSSAKVRPGFIQQEPEPEIFSLEGELISYLADSNPYDEYTANSKGFLNRFDAGLYASLEYKLRKGFSIGLAGQYQLSPATNPKGTLNYKELNKDQEFVMGGPSKKLWNTMLYLAITF